MSLLTALLAFVPGALIARPEPEPEPESGVKVLDEMRRTMDKRFTALHREIDGLTTENVRLRLERDDALARLAVHQRVQRLQILSAQADQQQINQQALSAYFLGGMQQQANLSNQQWPHCTCVPGRYDALRQEYPRVFDAGHGHGA